MSIRIAIATITATIVTMVAAQAAVLAIITH